MLASQRKRRLAIYSHEHCFHELHTVAAPCLFVDYSRVDEYVLAIS